MNLGQIRADVETELQYAPDLLAHRHDIRNVVNRVYQQLARERSWPWLFRQAPMWGLPDMEFSPAAPATIMKVAATGPRSFNLVVGALATRLGFASSSDELTVYLQHQLQGAELDIASGDRSVGDGNWERGPFVIERVEAADPNGAAVFVRIDLDPRCNITSFDGTEGNLVIRPRRLQLPVDLDSLACLRDDQGFVLPAVTPSQAREHLSPLTGAGSPSYVLEDGGHDAHQPMFLQSLGTTGEARFEHTQFFRQTENWPVRGAFTLGTTDPVNGTMTVGTRVRVFLSWYYSGRFGPPSATVEHTVDDFRGVKITGIPLLPETTGTMEYGRRIAVFMAEEEGAFFFRGFHTDPGTNTYSILASNQDVSAMGEGLRFPRWDEWYPGRYQYVRLHPVPSGLQRFTVEYWARARHLVEDTDAPEFEEGYHPLLVWLACVEFATRFGGQDALQRFILHATRLRAMLDARYFPQERHNGMQRGMIGRGRLRRPVQTVDWNGDT